LLGFTLVYRIALNERLGLSCLWNLSLEPLHCRSKLSCLRAGRYQSRKLQFLLLCIFSCHWCKVQSGKVQSGFNLELRSVVSGGHVICSQDLVSTIHLLSSSISVINCGEIWCSKIFVLLTHFGDSWKDKIHYKRQCVH
jgi:hypothetical protein